MKRESFKSRLGFILVSAGCAIGIGNVWRFPYVVGQNGGGIFVLFYLLFLLILGIPVLTMELAVGRASKKSAYLAYKELEKPKSFWHIQGWAGIIGCYILMMYYTTVSGWMFNYMFKFMFGTFQDGMNTSAISNVFNSMLANPLEMGLWTGIIIVLGCIVCSFSLQSGLEKVSKYMMGALLILMIAMVVYSFTLPNALKGLKFFLVPDFSSLAQNGIGNTITSAMNQAFFTLSLGIGCMEIFGSYMSKEKTLASESIKICVLDTFVAICSGLIIFPACFSYGVEVSQGPSLIFITLPNVFLNLPGGRIWGSLFFIFMTFASFSTVIAVFENIISFCMDTFKISRKKSALINFFIVLVASIPCVLGYNIWSAVSIPKIGNILSIEDFAVSNLLLPIGSLIYVLFCSTKFGWGYDNYLAEANTGSGIKMQKWMKWYFIIVVPILIIFILVQGLIL